MLKSMGNESDGASFLHSALPQVLIITLLSSTRPWESSFTVSRLILSTTLHRSCLLSNGEMDAQRDFLKSHSYGKCLFLCLKVS